MTVLALFLNVLIVPAHSYPSSLILLKHRHLFFLSYFEFVFTSLILGHMCHMTKNVFVRAFQNDFWGFKGSIQQATS